MVSFSFSFSFPFLFPFPVRWGFFVCHVGVFRVLHRIHAQGYVEQHVPPTVHAAMRCPNGVVIHTYVHRSIYCSLVAHVFHL